MRRTLGIVALLVELLSSPEARSAPTQHVGVNAHQPAADILDGMKDLGAGWVRIDFNWYQIQPQAAVAPDFSFFDTLINSALARGLKVFPTIGYAPAWAAEADKDGKPNNNTPKVGEYGKFCQAAAARYQGKITHWGLWNEPNLGDFFEGTRQQWIDRVIVEGIQGIKAGCPTCQVLGPELASIGNDYWVWLDDVLKQLKAKGLMFDAITWHIYATFIELKPTWACWDGDLFLHKLDQHRVCFGIHIGLSVREVLLQNGLGSLPVWITETGKTAHGGNAAEEADQLSFYRRVLEEQLKRPWWTHTFFYEIVDDNAIADKWGMAVRTGSAPSFPGSYQLKAVWALLKKALAQQPAFGGSGTDCDDGLDNDGDQKIDYPKDTDCASASAPSEGKVVTPDAGPDRGASDAAPAPREGGADRGASGDRARLEVGGADAAVGREAGGDRGGGSSSGCACGVGGASDVGGLLLAALAALPLAWRRRRR
jgi:MYXO-CTERM domain-containing protein